MNWEPQICRALRLRPPLTPTHFLSFTLSMPLDFDPGTDAKYSNVGYVALGEVVAKASGQPYHTFVAEQVLKPMGIKSALHRRGQVPRRRAIRTRDAGGRRCGADGTRRRVDWVGGGCAVPDELDGSRVRGAGEKARKWMMEFRPAPLAGRGRVALGWAGQRERGR